MAIDQMDCLSMFNISCRSKSLIHNFSCPYSREKPLYFSYINNSFIETDLVFKNMVLVPGTAPDLVWGYKGEPGSAGAAFDGSRANITRGKLIGGTGG